MQRRGVLLPLHVRDDAGDRERRHRCSSDIDRAAVFIEAVHDFADGASVGVEATGQRRTDEHRMRQRHLFVRCERVAFDYLSSHRLEVAG